ncbi:MAG: lanthionine synthetase LanC family protein [Chitinophagaceae bacterium]
MNTTQNACTEAALQIALGICRDAIWQDHRCNWIGTGTEDHYGMPKGYARALSANFYDGLSGIAWFLLHLQQQHPHALVRKTLAGALEQLVQQETAAKNEDLHGKLGFQTGWTGMVYVLQRAGEMLNEPRYTEAAAALLEKIMQLPTAYWGLDVIDGAAGAIPALIRIHNRKPGEPLRRFILSVGTYLIEKAEKRPDGWSWNTLPDSSHPLTGYGHGAAGFAAAFAELYAFTGNNEYRQVTNATAKYEDSHFVAAQQNWPDFRNFNSTAPAPTEQVCSLAWCHGAPGIGMSRLRIMELTGDPGFRQGAEAAVTTTANNLSVLQLGNYSLCHGVFGNAELLLYAAELFQQPVWKEKALAAAEECIKEYISKRIPVPNGLQSGHETPDFMLGSSGIGYFFLRLAAPESVPSMLLLR